MTHDPSTVFLPKTGWLTGHILVAMPGMPDPRFAHSIIYICSHGPNGAMGITLNRLFLQVDFRMMLDQLNIEAMPETPEVPIFSGGPVEVGRGFVLHSADYMREGTVKIDDQFALSATIEVLKAIASRSGPKRLLVALGYSGWGAGQLEDEVKANGWLTVPADEELLFGTAIDGKWEQALAKIGISPIMLSGEAGHA